MQKQGVSRSQLAERLGTSRAYVTKLLDGQENMTLKTIVRVANALDLKVDLKLRPRGRRAANETPVARRSSRAREDRLPRRSAPSPPALA